MPLVLVLSWAVFLSSSLAYAADRAGWLRVANNLYQESRCEEAISAYERIYRANKNDLQTKALSLYRIGYCELQLENWERSAIFFFAFLKLFPEDNEARFRRMQALEKLKDWSELIITGEKITKGEFYPPARLMMAQAYLAQDNSTEAARLLRSSRVNGEWRKIFHYWLGVSSYQAGRSPLAAKIFEKIKAASPDKTDWLHSGSRQWLKKIQRDKKRFHGRFTLGFVYDSNVEEQSLVNTSSTGVPSETGPSPSTYESDSGLNLDLYLSYRLLERRNWTLYTIASANALYYRRDFEFSTQGLSIGIGSAIKLSRKFSLSTAIRYLDSRYDNSYYQDYLISDINLSYMLSSTASIQVSLPYTIYLRSRFFKSLAPGIATSFYLHPFFVSGGYSYTQTTGNKAEFSVSSGLLSLDAGTINGLYESHQLFLSLTTNLSNSTSVTGQIAYYNTQYEAENIPSGSGVSGSDPREDRLWTIGISAAKSIIPELLSLTAGFTFYSNESTGLQGLSDGEEAADYNYNRSVWSLNSVLIF